MDANYTTVMANLNMYKNAINKIEQVLIDQNITKKVKIESIQSIINLLNTDIKQYNMFNVGDKVFVYINNKLDRISTVTKVNGNTAYVDGAPYIKGVHNQRDYVNGTTRQFFIRTFTNDEYENFVQSVNAMDIPDWIKNRKLDL